MSVFELLVVQQYVKGFIATAAQCGTWQPHQQLRTLVEEHFSGVTTTAPVEELNGLMKNSHAARASVKCRRLEPSLAAGLASQCLTSRHHYRDFPTASGAVKRKSVKMAANAFGKKPHEPSLPVKGISSTKQKADFPRSQLTAGCQGQTLLSSKKHTFSTAWTTSLTLRWELSVHLAIWCCGAGKHQTRCARHLLTGMLG